VAGQSAAHAEACVMHSRRRHRSDACRSEEHQGRVLDQFAQGSEIFGSDGSVHNAVVAAEGNRHTFPNNDLTLRIDDWFLYNRPDSYYRRLRWIDNREELLDAVRPERRDGDCSALIFLWFEFLVASTRVV